VVDKLLMRRTDAKPTWSSRKSVARSFIGRQHAVARERVHIGAGGNALGFPPADPMFWQSLAAPTLDRAGISSLASNLTGQ
jgi:hypothetical protein